MKDVRMQELVECENFKVIVRRRCYFSSVFLVADFEMCSNTIFFDLKEQKTCYGDCVSL